MNIKGGGVGEEGKREMVENHKVDRGEGEGRRENLGERKRRKNGKMENGGKVRDMGKWNGEDYKVVINII